MRKNKCVEKCIRECALVSIRTDATIILSDQNVTFGQKPEHNTFTTSLKFSNFRNFFVHFETTSKKSKIYFCCCCSDRAQVTVLITFGPWEFDQNPCEALQNYLNAGIEIILILVDTNPNLFACFPNYGFDIYFFETIEDLTQSWNSTFTSFDVCQVKANYFSFFSLDQFIL